ncbi:MAG: hypothetical protein KJ072_26690 [Verrucomicrobia bacterium]|nr:hypothetical protein [Verrucomicrobiota bacterium]
MRLLILRTLGPAIHNHVESGWQSNCIAAPDTARRRWNKDGEHHTET